MKRLAEMRIRPAKNGGHTISHEYEREAKAMGGGNIGMMAPKAEEHVFGPEDGEAMLRHIGKHLNVPMRSNGAAKPGNKPESEGEEGY